MGSILCAECRGKATWRSGERDVSCVGCGGIGYVLLEDNMISMIDLGLPPPLPPVPPPEEEVAPPPTSARLPALPDTEDIAAIQPAELQSIARAVKYAITVQRPETAAALLDGKKQVESRSFRIDGQWVAIQVGSVDAATQSGTCAVQAASHEDVGFCSEGFVHGLIFFQGSKKNEEVDDPRTDEVGPICNYRQKCLRIKPVELAGGSEGKWVLSNSSCKSIREAILAGPLAAFGFKKSSSDFSGSPASLQPQQATPPQDSVPEASTISSCAVTEIIQESLRSATDGPGFRTTRTTTVEIHRGIRICTHICECTHMCVGSRC